MAAPDRPAEADDPALLAAELPPEAATMPGPAMPITAAEYGVNTAESAAEAQPPQPLSYATPGAPRWRVGTLAYTAGGLATLFCLLLAGDFALSMRDRSVGPVAQLMLKRFGATDSMMAFLLSTLPQTLAVLIGPVISFKSDRLRSRWGRRIPYLLVPTPVAALAMVGLAFSGDFGRWAHQAAGPRGLSANAFSLLYFGTCWTLFESCVVVAGAVMGALINDVVPRPVLGRFYGLFRAVSLIAGMIFNFWAMGHADVHYRAILIGMGVLFAVGFTVMCLTVREGAYPPPQPVAADALASGRRLAAVKLYLRESFRDPYYRWVFAAVTFAGATFLPVNLFSLPYARQINLSLGIYGQLIALTYAISLALAWPMGWLVDRLSSLTVATGSMLLYASSMLTSGVAVHSATTFGAALVVHGVLSGCYFTAAASLGQSLFPRLKYGQFASAAGLVQSLFTMTVGQLLGPLLDLTDHNYRLTFYVAGGLGVGAASCLLVVIRLHRRRPAEQANA